MWVHLCLRQRLLIFVRHFSCLSDSAAVKTAWHLWAAFLSASAVLKGERGLPVSELWVMAGLLLGPLGSRPDSGKGFEGLSACLEALTRPIRPILKEKSS
jgi:hypothetical protein